ncbi:MAG TPA: YceI family protein [Mucilaginibacter sp.]|nr:YceI family protein [Mucilaginibacter sp.]
MKKYPLLILLLSVTIAAFSQVKHTITKSSVTFQLKNLGVNTGGVFGAVKGDLLFDPAHLDASSIAATIDANTINTDNDTRDEHLKSDSYFDAVKYPKITIRSVSLKHKSGNNYIGTFNLTIKDKSNPVELPFTYTQTGDIAVFKGTLKIQRTDYGVGNKSLVMSNDVTITIDVATSK